MENVVHRLSLDLTKPDAWPRVEVQKDNARTLVISLTQNGRPYWIAEGVTAVFSAKKPDGNKLFNGCAVEKNAVRYDFTDQTTNVVGITECEILLYSGDERILASPRFELSVDDTIHQEGDIPESATEVTALTQMVAAGTAMIEDLRAALAGLEGAEEVLAAAQKAAAAAADSEETARNYAGAADNAANRAEAAVGEAAEYAGAAEEAGAAVLQNADRVGQMVAGAGALRDQAQAAAAAAANAANRAEAAAQRAESASGGDGSGGGPGGSDVDLTGYLTESEAERLYQPKGDYLTEVPDGYARAEDIPAVPAWALEDSKPGYSKAEVGLGNVDNVRQYSAQNPPPYPVASVNGMIGAVQLAAADVGARPDNWMPTADAVGADSAGTASRMLTAHNTERYSHEDIRILIQDLSDRLNAALNSTDADLDQMAEIVAYIKSNKSLIDAVTTGKVSVADIADNLVTNVGNKPLSAAQGVVLKGLVDGVSANLANYQPKGNYLTEHQDISHLLPREELPEAVEEALAAAKESGEFDGAAGQRGTGILKVTTAPSSYTTSTGGKNPIKRMAISTIKSQAGVEEVLEGDLIAYSYYQYHVYYLDGTYAYMDTYVSVRGAAGDDGDAATIEITGVEALAYGAAPTVAEVSGSTAQARKYVVGIPAGKPGDDGETPVRGVDYDTPEDRAELESYIISELAKRGQIKPEFANNIEECTDTSKLYVLPDGYIYAYMLTTVESGPSYTNLLPRAINADGTPYIGTNGEKGYKTGYRLNSSADEVASAANCCTGFIPAKSTDTIRFKNIVPASGGNGYILFYDSNFTRSTGTMYEFWSSGLYEFVPASAKDLNSSNRNADSNMAYFRISSGTISDGTIITINEEIVEGGTTTEEYAWANTGHAFVPADYESRIIALEEQVGEHTADIANLKKGISSVTPIKDWDAPIYDANIPVFQLSAEKAAMTDVRNTSTPDSLYAMYDALMAQYPHYITKTDLGVCSDGVNHVYCYDFRDHEQRHTNSRNSETKAKAILVSGIHYEWAGIYGLYYALEEITTNPALRDLKRNVHLIVIPCCNPFVTIRENIEVSGGQQNANGVEVHRNFEVEFKYPGDSGYVAPGELHHGGTEPLSEVESQYIDDVLKQNPDAAFFMTCHNFNLDEIYGVSFLWPSVATAYMCNMGYRLIDRMSQAWMDKYGEELAPGIASYRTELLESWDTRLGYAQISGSPGTETKQATKYGIQAANVEICERFHVHGTKEAPEPILSSFTLSRGAEALVNFMMMCFGVYDHKDKKEYAPWAEES